MPCRRGSCVLRSRRHRVATRPLEPSLARWSTRVPRAGSHPVCGLGLSFADSPARCRFGLDLVTGGGVAAKRLRGCARRPRLLRSQFNGSPCPAGGGTGVAASVAGYRICPLVGSCRCVHRCQCHRASNLLGMDTDPSGPTWPGSFLALGTRRKEPRDSLVAGVVSAVMAASVGGRRQYIHIHDRPLCCAAVALVWISIVKQRLGPGRLRHAREQPVWKPQPARWGLFSLRSGLIRRGAPPNSGGGADRPALALKTSGRPRGAVLALALAVVIYRLSLTMAAGPDRIENSAIARTSRRR